MYCATIVWAYDDMDLARRLWPRVKTAVEEQVSRDNLDMDVGRQRQVIAAIVNDLMEKKQPRKRHWCSPKSISKLLHLFRRPNALPVPASIAESGAEPVAMARHDPVSKPKPVSKNPPMSKPKPVSKSVFLSNKDSLPKPGPVPKSPRVPAALSAERR